MGRIVLAMAGLVACTDGSDEGGVDCEPGTERCACEADNRCQSPLTCLSDVCVDSMAITAFDANAGDPDSGTDAGMDGVATGVDAAIQPRGDAALDGGSAAASDAGGGGASAGCTSAADCPAASEPCRQAVCLMGACSNAAVPDGTLVDDGSPGDCRALRCGSGGLSIVLDETDLPADDGDPCTVASCLDGDPVQRVGPRSPLPADQQTAGDCMRAVCDVDGVVIGEADVTDWPRPTSTCKVARCDGSTPVVEQAPVGQPCGSGLVCDAAGSCGACLADGTVCTNSSQCCGRLCDAGHCASCAAERGDCDGDASNGCEQWINEPNRCGSCLVDCINGYALPGVSPVDRECVDGDHCRITRCDVGLSDTDGEFDNGCEAPAEVGPGGPYAGCTAATAADDCGPAERCVVPSTTGGGLLGSVVTTLCMSNSTGCYCSLTCDAAHACPGVPTGTASPVCGGPRCVLLCADDPNGCPKGMKCTAAPGNLSHCVYE